MNITEKIMKKIYVLPLCKAIDVDAKQIICGSDTSKMEFTDTEKATHSDNPEEDVLVRKQSRWDTEW